MVVSPRQIPPKQHYWCSCFVRDEDYIGRPEVATEAPVCRRPPGYQERAIATSTDLEARVEKLMEEKQELERSRCDTERSCETAQARLSVAVSACDEAQRKLEVQEAEHQTRQQRLLADLEHAQAEIARLKSSLSDEHAAVSLPVARGQGADAAAGEAGTRKDQLLREIDRTPENAVLYATLADELSDGEAVFVPALKQRMRQVELFQRAIELDPTCACFYSDLGSILYFEELESVCIRGALMGEVDLCIRALELDPTLAITYLNLEEAMQHHGLHKVHIGGKDFCAKDLTEAARSLGMDAKALAEEQEKPGSLAHASKEVQALELTGTVHLSEDGRKVYVPGRDETELSKVLNKRHLELEGTILAPRSRRTAHAAE